MIRSSIEKDVIAKKEGYINESRNPKEPCSSMPWSALKDPRVVQVSRSFGGKDRHSKVRTIRGLRDRRIRLSVETAVQLYDLQERLGLNQPSKVVDWLLNASQHAIHELPLLQLPIQNCVQYAQPTVAYHEETSSQAPSTYLSHTNTEFLKTGGAHSLNLLSGNGDVNSRNDMIIGADETKLSKSMNGNSNVLPFRPKCKDARKERVLFEKSDWMKRNEQENEVPIEDHSAQSWIYNTLPRASHSFLTSSLSSAKPYASCYHFEHPSNAPVSHLGIHGSSSQPDELHNFNATPFQSSLALQSGSQLLLYQPGTAASIIPSNIAPQNASDPKQIASFQMFSSSSQNLQPNSIAARAFQLSIASEHHHSHNNHLSQSNALEKGNGEGDPSSAAVSSSCLFDLKTICGSNISSFMCRCD